MFVVEVTQVLNIKDKDSTSALSGTNSEMHQVDFCYWSLVIIGHLVIYVDQIHVGPLCECYHCFSVVMRLYQFDLTQVLHNTFSDKYLYTSPWGFIKSKQLIL